MPVLMYFLRWKSLGIIWNTSFQEWCACQREPLINRWGWLCCGFCAIHMEKVLLAALEARGKQGPWEWNCLGHGLAESQRLKLCGATLTFLYVLRHESFGTSRLRGKCSFFKVSKAVVFLFIYVRAAIPDLLSLAPHRFQTLCLTWPG